MSTRRLMALCATLALLLARAANGAEPSPQPSATQAAPPGMVWVPGGEFWMGTEEEHMPDARPVHRVYVDGFWMDRTEVTN